LNNGIKIIKTKPYSSFRTAEKTPSRDFVKPFGQQYTKIKKKYTTWFSKGFFCIKKGFLSL
jgi:hypothetical protein